jgi:long-subunit acyl-CoA synthetase (AMP-forming)
MACRGHACQMRLIGLFAKNREEWVIAEQACNAYSYVTVCTWLPLMLCR